jgi:hypothetical protein
LLIFVSPIVLAVKTPIIVHSHPNHTISINLVDPETEESLEHFVGNSGKSGIFSKDAQVDEEFKLVLLVSKDKKFVVPPTTFGNYTPGSTLEFLLTKTEIKKISDQDISDSKDTEEQEENINESVNTEIDSEATQENEEAAGQEISEDEEENNEQTSNEALAGITGKAISDDEKPLTRGIMMKIGIIIFLSIFSLFGVFLTLKLVSQRKNRTKEDNIKFTKYQDFKEKIQKSSAVSKKLSEAEKRLKSAQDEVERLKRIREIEKEMHKNEKELNKLKKKEDR